MRSRETSVVVGVGGDDDDALADTADRRRRRSPASPSMSTPTPTAPTPPPTTTMMPAKSKGRHDAHPGLRGYHDWRTVVASLYRIYAVPTRRGGGLFSRDTPHAPLVGTGEGARVRRGDELVD